ncbi:unnamed protein product [Prunus armeniaca]
MLVFGSGLQDLGSTVMICLLALNAIQDGPEQRQTFFLFFSLIQTILEKREIEPSILWSSFSLFSTFPKGFIRSWVIPILANWFWGETSTSFIVSEGESLKATVPRHPIYCPRVRFEMSSHMGVCVRMSR